MLPNPHALPEKAIREHHRARTTWTFRTEANGSQAARLGVTFTNHRTERNQGCGG
jgi:hypothetical protein